MSLCHPHISNIRGFQNPVLVFDGCSWTIIKVHEGMNFISPDPCIANIGEYPIHLWDSTMSSWNQIHALWWTLMKVHQVSMKVFHAHLMNSDELEHCSSQVHELTPREQFMNFVHELISWTLDGLWWMFMNCSWTIIKVHEGMNFISPDPRIANIGEYPIHPYHPLSRGNFYRQVGERWGDKSGLQ